MFTVNPHRLPASLIIGIPFLRSTSLRTFANTVAEAALSHTFMLVLLVLNFRLPVPDPFKKLAHAHKYGQLGIANYCARWNDCAFVYGKTATPYKRRRRTPHTLSSVCMRRKFEMDLGQAT